MSIKCDVCDVMDNGAELFRCDVCDRVICAKCLSRYSDELEAGGSGSCGETQSERFGLLNKCPGCAALTLELWPDDDDSVMEV